MKLTIPKNSFKSKFKFKKIFIPKLGVIVKDLFTKLHAMRLLDYFQLIELSLLSILIFVAILLDFTENLPLLIGLTIILISIKIIEMLYYGGQIWPIVSYDLYLLTFISVVLLTNIMNSEEIVKQTLGWNQIWEVGSLLLIGTIFYFVTTLINNKYFHKIKIFLFSVVSVLALINIIFSQMNEIISGNKFTTTLGIISLMILLFGLGSTRINKNKFYRRLIFILSGISVTGFIFTFDSFVLLLSGLVLIIAGVVYSKYAETLGRILVILGLIIGAIPIAFSYNLFLRLIEQYENIALTLRNYNFIDLFIGANRGSSIAVADLFLSSGMIATIMAILFVSIIFISLWTYYSKENQKIITSIGIFLLSTLTLSLFVSPGNTNLILIGLVLFALIYTLTVQTKVKNLNLSEISVYIPNKLPNIAVEAVSISRSIIIIAIIIYIPTIITFVLRLV